ncbi:MAG: hypothetical protein EBS23_09435, partial [Betaproteobacteria bacterium]|nr:hypothetical protein [Betaproteobacteria bacterium]
GGTIVAWSDVNNSQSVTTVSGTLTAQGGTTQGNGGNIETSGHQLKVDGITVNASAPNGTAGNWLLDPYNITISAAPSPAEANTSSTTTNGTNTIQSNATGAVIHNTTIEAALNSGTNVTVQTGGSTTVGTDPGHITVASSITKSAGTDATLTLKAHSAVSVEAGITSTFGKLNVVLWSDFDGTQDGGIGGIKAPISTNGGHLWAGGTAPGGGSSTWNGLTVGNGPSVGSAGANVNPFDLSSSISTAGGDALLWAGTSSADTTRNGLGIKKSGSVDPSINTGSGDLTLIARSLYNWDNSGATLGVSTTGTLTLAPDTASAWSSFNWNGSFSGTNNADFTLNNIGGAGQPLKISNVANLGGLNIGGYGSVTNTSNVTVSSAMGLSGPIDIRGGTVSVGNSISTSGSANINLTGSAAIDLLGTGRINSSAANVTLASPLVYVRSGSGSVIQTGGNVSVSTSVTGNLNNDHLKFANRAVDATDIDILNTQGNNFLLGLKYDDTAGLFIEDIRNLNASGTLTLGSTVDNGSQICGFHCRLTAVSGFNLTSTDLSGNLKLMYRVIDAASGSSFALGSGQSLTLQTLSGDGATSTFAATISGAGSLIKSGNASLTLSGTNTYTGGIDVNGGILQAGSDSAFGSSAIRLAAGTTLRASNSAGQLAGTGVEAVTRTLSNNVALDGETIVDTNGNTFTLSGVVSGTGALRKGGSGTLVLGGTTSHSNNYFGGTKITGGTLQIGADSNLGDANGALTFDGGTLKVTANTTLAASRSVALDSHGGTFNTDASVLLSYAGGVTGSGILTKTGSGSLSLAGANTYTGNTTVNAGSLNVTGTLGASANYGGAIAIGSGASLTVGSSSTQTLSGVVSGAGSLTKAGAGTTTLTAANTYTGGTTVSGGTLAISSDSNLGAAPTTATASSLVLNGGTLQATLAASGTSNSFALSANRGVTLGSAGGSFNTDASVSLSYAGVLAGTGGLTKAGSGTLTLSGANTYSGGTTVSGGTLAISSDSNLGAAPTAATAGALRFKGGTLQATLAPTGTSNSFALSANRGIHIDTPGGNITTDSGVTLSSAAAVTANGNLTKNGLGTLAFSGSYSFSPVTGSPTTVSTTTINAGSLVLQNDTPVVGGSTSGFYRFTG